MARVLIDGYWWKDGPPSGRNVVRDLTRAWARDGRDHITVVVRKGCRSLVQEVVTERDRISVIELPTVVRPHLLAVLWMGLVGLRHDIILTQNFCPPIGGRLRAVFIHDGIFKEHPEWFRRRERLYLAVIPVLAHRAAKILTSSHSESQRLSRIWPRFLSKIVAVQLGLPSGLVSNDQRSLEISSIDNAALVDLSPGYILSVGRLNVRKNLTALVHAYLSLPENSSHIPPLVIVGEPEGKTDERVVSTALGTRRVVFTGSVSDGELAALYTNAGLFVFPSLDEGFGLPLIEAAYFRVPVVCSDIPVFRELGVPAEFFDPRSSIDLADKLSACLLDDSAKSFSSLDSVARDVADRYSWATVVSRIRQVVLKQDGVL